MRSISLLHFARFKPLAAWSVSASVLGVALALLAGEGTLVGPASMVLAIICVALMQYVAHPMNDLMDLDLDRQAPIGPTGRHKPLVDGNATVPEVQRLSAVVVVIILLILTYLILLRPVLIAPAAYGMIALFGYNHPRLRWAYKPYTELYLSAPVNALSVLVISFIGSGTITAASVAVSAVFGFASSTFFVSMMSMDYPTDRLNGKITSIVRWPHVRYCTGYPMLGLAVAIGAIPVLILIGGLTATTAVCLCVLTFAVLAALGSGVDDLRLKFIYGGVQQPEGMSARLRLGQLYVSVLFSVALSIVLLAGGLGA
ncbi:MAG: UbiA family prenyltransferase [Methanomassiliicoccus sp.]|nr:UbiA family prenyltransferase [Methanomassiliicoccus sp.]